MKDIPPRTAVFIDANIFIYAILAVPQYVESCNSFLKRVENHEINGYPSILVISEVIHKLMFSRSLRSTRSGPKPF